MKVARTVLKERCPQEVEAMFTHSDLRKTRVYQDAVLEGEQRGFANW
jgi:predicted transposase YdaD